MIMIKCAFSLFNLNSHNTQSPATSQGFDSNSGLVNEQLKQLLTERELLREYYNVKSGGTSGGSQQSTPADHFVQPQYAPIGGAGTAESRPTTPSTRSTFFIIRPAHRLGFPDKGLHTL
jgi:hypothetical protein